MQSQHQDGWFNKLISEHQSPCISIYQPVHRAAPLTAEDPIRYEGLLKEAEQVLRREYAPREIEPLMDKLKQAASDRAFWEGSRDGVALFASPDYFQVVELPQPVSPMAVVADSFHIKPLIRILQHADRYQVLALSQRDVRLYEGDPYRLEEIAAINVPQTVLNAGGAETTRRSPASDARRSDAQTGQVGLLTNPQNLLIEQLVRAVDEVVWERHSRGSRLPLILAAMEEYQSIFRKVSRNPYLVDQGIRLNPVGIPLNRLHREAWTIMEPRVQRRLADLRERFGAAKAHALGSDDLARIAQKAAAGAVDTLLIEADRRIVGRFNPVTGEIHPAAEGDGRADDLLDDLAEAVLKRDGDVLVAPRDQMPTDTGAAAIFRY